MNTRGAVVGLVATVYVALVVCTVCTTTAAATTTATAADATTAPAADATTTTKTTTVSATASEGRGHFKKMMLNPYMLIPQLIALGFAPIVLANLKMMVMSALMINNMALNAAIFMTVRNMVFGPRPKVKYVNYGYREHHSDHHGKHAKLSQEQQQQQQQQSTSEEETQSTAEAEVQLSRRHSKRAVVAS